MKARVAFTFLALVVITAKALLTSRDDPFLSVDHNGPSTKGTDFYIGFLTNAEEVIQSTPIYQIFASTDEPEPVTFTVSLNENLPDDMREGFPLTTTVSYGEVVTVTFHERMAVQNSNSGSNLIERSKAIRVRTENGKRVTVQGFNDNVRTSDGFIAFPCDGMRNEVFTRYEYFVLAADQNPSEDDLPKNSLSLIIPCDNNTQITVEPSQLVTFSGLQDLPRRPSALQAGPGAAASTTTFTADAGQTVLISHPNDLSGTIVQSNNPVVLLSGHECGEIPLDTTACDHMVDQMPPGFSLGTKFFLVPIAARVSGDLFRVGTLTDGTQVKVTCVTQSNDVPEEFPLDKDGIIDRGGFIEFMTPGNTENQMDWKPSYCCLDATAPVIVAQYSTGYSYDSSFRGKENVELGDPFMTIVSPVTQYLNNYTMTSLTGVSGPFPFRYVGLSIAASFFNNSNQDQARVKLNDDVVTTLDGWIPMYCSSKEVCGYGAQVEVPRGDIRVYHEEPDVGLGISYYAYQQQNSYGMPQGYELTPIAATRVILENIEVPEDIGVITINILRIGDLSLESEGILTARPTTPVQADISDYVAFDPIVLVYRGGSTRQDVVTFRIEIIDDDVVESSHESFEIVGMPVRNLFFPLPVMTVTIIDNDHVVVEFQHSSYTVNEFDREVEFTIVKRTQTTESVSILFTTTDGSAIAPGDYLAVISREVTFSAAETVQVVKVTIQQDRISEEAHFFTATLSVSPGVSQVQIGDQFQATATITDDDVVTLGFNSELYSVEESSGVVVLVVEIRNTNLDREVTVQITTIESSATAGIDFVASTEILSFSPGDDTKSFEVTIINDSVFEGPQEFSAVIATTESRIDIFQRVATVQIIDDDVLEIRFSSTLYPVIENAGTVVLIAEIRNTVTEREVTVQFATIGASAEVGIDFIVSSGELTFSPGDTQETFEVTIINDSTFEGPEEFSAQLTTAESRVEIIMPDPTIEIIDDDEIFIRFNPTSYTVTEGGSVQLILQKINTTEQAITVVLSTQEGTAGFSDFVSVSDITVTVESDEFEKYVAIKTMADNVVEVTEEFSAVIISTSDRIIVTEERAIVSIVDTGDVVVGFLPVSYRVNEADGAVTLTIVKRSQTSARVTVQIITQDGSATALSDYVNVTREVVFEAHEVVKEVQVMIQQDNSPEKLEMFTAILIAQDGGGTQVTIGEDGVATIAIEDDDIAVVEFVQSAYTVLEGDGRVEVCLRIDRQVSTPIAVRLTPVPDTAEAGLDYSPGLLNLVNFQPTGDSVMCAEFEIIDDLVALEDEERFVVEVTTEEGPVTIGRTSQTLVIIQDNDDLIVTHLNEDISMSEGDCTIQICLVKDKDTAEAFTVDVFLSEFPSEGETAIAGADVVAINTTITFAPLDREACTMVKITEDILSNQFPDNFIVNFTNDMNVPIPPLIINVIDNDADGDVRICQITETFAIFPFNSNDSYQFQGLCDHYLLQSCDGLEDVSVTADFISTNLSSARVGVRYGDSSVISTETGDVVFNNLAFIRMDGNAQIYSNGFVIYRESGINRILLRLTGTITVTHKYEGDDRSIQVAVSDNLSFGGTDVPSTAAVCGLCGNTDGTLLQADLLTIAEITNQEQITEFIEGYVVKASEHFLRGQRRECGIVRNDTVSGDPVFTVPILGGGALCYDVRGEPGVYLNLVSDKCTSVTADYEAMDVAENGNIMSAIGIRVVGSGGKCHNIEVKTNGDNPVITLVDDAEISGGVFERNGIHVRTYSNRVRVSVPNCDLIDLIMWVTKEDKNGQAMLRLQISRGYNLASTSHGLIGQFWNVPVSIEPYSGPVRDDYANVTESSQLYLITVTGSKPRSFLAELFAIPWDRRSGPCYYAGDSEGGKTGISDDFGSVIEGKYTDYQLDGLFSHDYIYTQFEEDRCTQDTA